MNNESLPAVSHMPATSRKPMPRSVYWLRASLLFLILASFLRVTWALDAKALWWDESLSLQRAESDWLPLLLGHLVMFDGYSSHLTIDQHPFFFFVLQGLLIRLAGNSEYVLRFTSVIAATLLVPVAWSFSRYLARNQVVPHAAATWAALFAAFSPFFLWFGQEARPYALWGMLALLSTYLLLRATHSPVVRWPWLVGYGFTMLMFLTTHYYAVFLLPVHVTLLFLWLAPRSRVMATAIAGSLLLAGAGAILVAYYRIIVQQGGGKNFQSISLTILIPDLLNAFTMGLSVNINMVWWLDLLAGGIVVIGGVWALRSRRTLAAGGWVPVAMITVPIITLMLINLIRPAYMTARHLSLIGGGFIVLLAAGFGLLWQLQRWVAALLTLLLLIGIGYSTGNYFTVEEYAKNDFVRLGDHLNRRLASGDLVLVKTPYAWRIVDYYVPAASLSDRANKETGVTVMGIPLMNRSENATVERLAALRKKHPRTWLITVGPYSSDAEREKRSVEWLDENLYQVQDTTFFSHSSLHATLYTSQVPVYGSVPVGIENPLDVVFGDQIRLVGYDVGMPAGSHLALPVTLYWQTTEPTDTHYKYRLTLVELAENGEENILSLTEREPYEGAIPTVFWEPGKTIVEYSELPPASWPNPDGNSDIERFQLKLQIYDEKTLAPLPITQATGASAGPDSHTLVLPYLPE